MKYSNALKTAVLTSLLVGGSVAARAETIAQGIASTTGAATPGSTVPGTIDSAYVTAIFNTNAYIQDSTGGIYAYQASRAGNSLNGLTVGTLLTTLGNGSFQYYATGNQFEYATANSTTNLTLGGSTAGTYASIPASYYSLVTTAGLNSAADQGSATSQGIQNQLVRLQNVTITAVGAADPGTFTSGGSYTLTDSAGSAILYVNAASAIVGTPVPTGTTTVSGIFQDFRGTSELLPRGTYDIGAVPEPSTEALLGVGGVALGTFAVGRARRRAC